MSASRWVVLEPSSDAGTERTAEARFVKDTFAPLAFVFLFFWMFYHRLWLAGIAVLALDIAFMMIGWWEGFSFLSSVTQFGLALLVGLEGRQILIANRLRKGWRMAAVVHADGKAEAELRYYNRDPAPKPEVQKAPVRSAAEKRDAALPWDPKTA